MALVPRHLSWAARSLRRTPLSSIAAIVTLALGIGGATAFFGLLDAAYLRPLPFPHAAQLMRLQDAIPVAGGGSYLANMSPRQVDFLRSRTRAFDLITCQRVESLTLLGAGAPEQLSGASVSAGSFELLGLAPIQGRGFTAAEFALGEGSGTVVISERLWQARLGGVAPVVGRTMRLDGRLQTIVGVAPAGFHFPYRADVWLPMRLEPSDPRDLLVIGRLRPGFDAAGARAEMVALTPEFRRQRQAAGPAQGTSPLPPAIISLREELLRDEQRPALALFATAVLFLIMASVSVACLLIARGTVSRRDVAIRNALGATRTAQVASSLADPFMLSLAGAAIATVAVWASAPALSALVPRVLREELSFEPIHLSYRVAAFAIAIALVTALLAGLAPALGALRSDPGAAMRTGRGGRVAARQRPLRTLLIGEIALLSLLLVAAVAFVGAFLRVTRAELGFEPRGVLALEVVAPRTRYADAPSLLRLLDRLQAEIGGLPGTQVAVSSINPLRGSIWGIGIRRADQTAAAESEANFRLISSGLFHTLELPLLHGRDFRPADATGPPVAIISQRLARRLWGRADVVGEQLARSVTGETLTMTVVGIAGDVADAGDLRESVYLPFAQLKSLRDENRFWVLARAPKGGVGWVRRVQRAFWAADRELAWSDLGWMDSMRSEALERERLGTFLATLFAAFAALLSGVGLAGVMGFILAQREVEIGVRQAVGADRGALLRMMTAEGLRLAAIGTAIGLASAVLSFPLLQHLVGGLARPRLPALALVAGSILAVCLLFAYLPARRAAALEPLRLLRG